MHCSLRSHIYGTRPRRLSSHRQQPDHTHYRARLSSLLYQAHSSNNSRSEAGSQRNMVKLIPKHELTQQRVIDAQRAEIETLQAEIERLKIENARLSKSALGKPLLKVTLPRPLPANNASSTPSYLRPTAASISRIAKPLEATTDCDREDDRSHMYADGKLVRVGSVLPAPNYRFTTASSKGKGGPTIGGGWLHNPYIEGEMLWETHPASPKPKQKYAYYDCETCNELEAAWNDPGTQSLAVRSRLNDADHKFQDSPAAAVNVPFRVQSRLMHSGLVISQAVVYRHFRKHCPSTQHYHFPEGPREVGMCRGELQGILGTFDVDKICVDDKDCGFKNYLARVTLLEVADLRNTIHHGNHETLVRVDVLLCRAQKLAVILMDEREAMKIRQLRDQLRQEAEKAMTEIETAFFGNWGPMPQGREWALHHQRTFSDLISSSNNGWESWRYKQASKAVQLAALEWDYRYGNHKPGELNAEYLALKAKAAARITLGRSATPPPEELTDEEYALMKAKMAENIENAAGLSEQEGLEVPSPSPIEPLVPAWQIEAANSTW